VLTLAVYSQDIYSESDLLRPSRNSINHSSRGLTDPIQQSSTFRPSQCSSQATSASERARAWGISQSRGKKYDCLLAGPLNRQPLHTCNPQLGSLKTVPYYFMPHPQIPMTPRPRSFQKTPRHSVIEYRDMSDSQIRDGCWEEVESQALFAAIAWILVEMVDKEVTKVRKTTSEPF